MTNAPNRFDLFILGPEEKRVEITEDTRIPHAATIMMNKEDHTLGNMLRHSVLAIPGVLFCGYKVPHPLEPRTLLKIQTDGSLTPVQALQRGCERVIGNINSLTTKFTQEFQLAAPGIGAPHGVPTFAGTGFGGPGAAYGEMDRDGAGYADF